MNRRVLQMKTNARYSYKMNLKMGRNVLVKFFGNSEPYQLSSPTVVLNRIGGKDERHRIIAMLKL
jgi:hypothetical protein